MTTKEATITEDTVVQSIDGLSVADLDGEAVVLSPHTGTYYGLNEVGTRAFELVREPRRIREVVADIADEYDADLDQLRADLLQFFREMVAERLVVVGRPTP